MVIKKKIRISIVLRNILLAIAAIFVILFVFSNFLTVYEQNKYPVLGELVELDGENMHIYTKGEGENTIVLLSGLGTTAPVLDFEPLVNELAKENKVIVVEEFGYGWSDLTKKERTVENIVGEIRTALQLANIKGPYILMPHSISGIYSMYYANKYPEEVKAIVGIDPTLPQALEYFGESAPTMPNFFSYLAPTGIARLAIYMNSDDFLPISEEDTYSNENLRMTKVISSWNGYNRNVVDEANEIKENIEKTAAMKFPSDIPVMIFTAKENKNNEGKSNVTFYREQLENGSANKLLIFEGHHYLHWTRFIEISETVNDFIKE
ncbi:alpha/beta fold hydrolase [Robertmurraya sp. P23]|uniref:alpha/beta fold hydrolase n=1 Tax=Robertmurraya sp. P23 TaxID=3436931 RepID=UPI003D9756D9